MKLIVAIVVCTLLLIWLAGCSPHLTPKTTRYQGVVDRVSHRFIDVRMENGRVFMFTFNPDAAHGCQWRAGTPIDVEVIDYADAPSHIYRVHQGC